MDRSLAIVDPALGYSEGHHRATVESLLTALPETSLALFGGIGTDALGFGKSAGHEIRVVDHFSQPPYSLHPDSSPEQKMDYVTTLATEYVNVFRYASSKVFLHHSVSWEHAMALATSLQYCIENDIETGQQVVCCIFNPGIGHALQVIDNRLYGYCQFAYGLLLKHSSVLLYASCAEYAVQYSKMLNLAEPFPICPILFDSTTPCSNTSTGKQTELLYLGDVKADKGFARLPRLLERRLAEADDVHLLIHYTEVRDPALKFSSIELDQLAASYPDRVDIVKGFLPLSNFETMLQTVSCIWLDYDQEHYENKTSGILWMAKKRGIEVRASEGTWMARENERLDDPCLYEYRQQLFRPISEWLEEVTAS